MMRPLIKKIAGAYWVFLGRFEIDDPYETLEDAVDAAVAHALHMEPSG